MTAGWQLIPIVSGYLDKLAARMRAEGFNPRLLLVQSNGGVRSAETAAQEPVRLLLSGPWGRAFRVDLTNASVRRTPLVLL